MANKVISVFLMCIVVMAALHVHHAAADDDGYKPCYENCSQECKTEGNGSTFCEMKCDTDCVQKMAAEKLKAFKP